MNKSELLRDAIKSQICEEWEEKISNSGSKKELLQMYIDGIDFCLDNNFPSNDYLKKNGGDLLAEFGIFIDENIEVENRTKVVLLGSCTSLISIDGYTVSQVFIKHDSSAHITVENHAFLVIDMFDNTSLNISATNESKVLVNVYGNAQLKHFTTENAIIKVVHKNKSTY